jgi:hypothetical protein
LPTCLVPAEIVIPIIQRYLDSYETNGDGNGGWNGPSGVTKLSANTFLAESAGMRADSFAKIMKGRTQYLSFYVVDRLLCAMDQPMKWHEEPLLSFYLEADLSAPPPGMRICAREGCDNEYQTTERGRRFCSRICGSADAHGYSKRDVFCRNHHPRTPENTLWRRKTTTGRLYRTCLICMRERESERVRVAA